MRQFRPALVVAIPTAPEKLAVIYALMITSVANRGWPGDVPITDYEPAGLPSSLVIRTAKIATLDTSAVEPLGCLPELLRDRVLTELRASLSTTGLR